MKQAKLKKLMSVLLAAVMTLSVAACGNESSTEKNKESESNVNASVASSQVTSETEVNEEKGVTFPLKEEVTFDIGVFTNMDANELAAKCQIYQEFYEATNVKINFVPLPTADALSSLNALFATKNEPDAIFSYWISDADLSNMVSNELLVPIDKYLTEELMPNLVNRVFAESNTVKGIATMPDGKIYALPAYNANMGMCLEGPIWINKNWVEKAGWKVEDIKTIDDLETVLTYFRDNDMNGNGIKDDEIPYIMSTTSSSNHVEVFLSLYGIATKDSTYNNYVFVENGEVKFAPLTQNWKDGIKKLNDWYEKGLIWKEVFTGTSETYQAKENSELPIIGLWNQKRAPQAGADEYVRLKPVSVDGYEASWDIYPGYMGYKSYLSVTRSCENVDILMAWMDQFYSFENAVRINNGEEEYGRWGYTADGLVEFKSVDNDTYKEIYAKSPWLAGICGMTSFGAYTKEDYAERLAQTDTYKTQQESYEMYEEYITDEPWPQPYFAAEDSARLVELRTDIFTTLSLKRAEWVTGVADIDKEYDAFVKDMEKMGIDEFVKILQKAYDVYNSQASK